MKNLFMASLAIALLVPVCAFAQSPITGTWKTEISSMQGSGKPVVFHLKDGMFECNCVPPVKVKADGADHAVAGHPDFDTVAVKILNDHSFQETGKKHGKVVGTTTFTVAADGKTGTSTYTNGTGNRSTSGELVLNRAAPGAPGSNAAAGTWTFGHVARISDNALLATYAIDGDTVKFSDPVGDSYVAKLDGKAVPFTDGSGATGTTVAVKRVGKDGLGETYYRDGKVSHWDTMTVSADGKTLKVVSHNVKSGRSMTSLSTWQ